MEGNDIGSFITRTVAVMFEGLIIIPKEDDTPDKRKFWQRPPTPNAEISIESVVRSWRPNELPLKSLNHLVNNLEVNVDVYTYFDAAYIEPIEHWLARKGISVSVYSYEDPEALMDDFKYNRDVHTLFTPFDNDAKLFGLRATVMGAGTWGL